MGLPTVFVDEDTRTARKIEVPNADFDTGCNWAGGGPGVGINFGEGAVVGTPEQFTLLDQNEAARAPQLSQYIGGDGLGDGNQDTFVIVHGANGPGYGDGSFTPEDDPGPTVFLNTLALGWVGPP